MVSCDAPGGQQASLHVTQGMGHAGVPGRIAGHFRRVIGHIHAISMALALFGSGVTAVECMGQTELAYVHLDYGGKADRPAPIARSVRRFLSREM